MEFFKKIVSFSLKFTIMMEEGWGSVFSQGVFEAM